MIVLSDLFDDVDAMMAGLKHLRHRRHEVILMHVLDPAEVDFPFGQPTLVPRPGGIARGAGRAARLRKAYLAEFGSSCATSSRLPRSSDRLRRCGPTSRWRWRCRVIWRRGSRLSQVPGSKFQVKITSITAASKP